MSASGPDLNLPHDHLISLLPLTHPNSSNTVLSIENSDEFIYLLKNHISNIDV